MKKITLLFALLLANVCVFAHVDPRKSIPVTHHMISKGLFQKICGKITTTKDDFSDAVFELTVQTASLTTENEMRDGHLKSPDIFDVENSRHCFQHGFHPIAGNRSKSRAT